MKLSAYLREKGFSHAAFGKTIGVSQPIMSGWVNGGAVPEKRAVQIERATEGAVTRIDLRPDDWHEIWPELAISEEKQPPASAARSSAATESVATNHPAPPQPAPVEAAATSQGVANV